MKTRDYRLGRRGEAAEETRRRIVEATFELHNEQGVVATSMKQIAERAGVSVGTVYHHFPTYEDAIRACGHFAAERSRPPNPTALAALADRRDRVARLAREVFGFYERIPGYARVRCDQGAVPLIREFVREEEANRLAMVRAALGTPVPPATRLAAIAAILDIAVYRALVAAGLSTEAAAGEIARIILASLDD